MGVSVVVRVWLCAWVGGVYVCVLTLEPMYDQPVVKAAHTKPGWC